MPFRLLLESELEKWAHQLTGRHITVIYDWSLSPLDYVAWSYYLNDWIRINANGRVFFRDCELKQKGYFLHELGHFCKCSKSQGANEFGAQFWAIKKCYKTGMESLNAYMTYMLGMWGTSECRQQTMEDGNYYSDSYFVAFKIGKRLRII